ncbi:hypothetical protein [Ferrovum sp.]|uniref:hypothetical protein n=1 Tax=Ferrovum sp. TaxID=2609467 RepID=UPI002618A612|nr:hypothetical protein [Ferrovum sp.]
MYIAGSFHTVRCSVCGGGKEWIDNDPHYWSSPPTWGICRNDLRRRADVGDYIFFVLPKAAKHSQSIFGYLKVQEKITHTTAYARGKLKSKRMSNKIPNGNIIVDASGRYNRFDAGAHQHMFDRIKDEYVIGEVANSRLLTADEIEALAPDFVSMLQRVFNSLGTTPIDLISRYGQTLSPAQIQAVLEWVNG